MPVYFEKSFCVYKTASKPRGVIYVGMTSDLAGRARTSGTLVGRLHEKYRVGRLVYFELHEAAECTHRRERLMKRWRRDRKIELIEKVNSTWRHLFADAIRLDGLEP